jgi:glycosyltransferase involved in cell wall biosynthesis
VDVVVLARLFQLSSFRALQADSVIEVSVVVPFYNGAATLDACLRALSSQNLPRDRYEIIAVDDGSTDDGASIATRHGVRLIRQENRGAPAARNAGLRAAAGEWVAFTDADCIPSRGWLRALLKAVGAEKNNTSILGAAGVVVGQPSSSRVARFVELSHGFDVERHLSHPRFPFALSGSVLYRRSVLNDVGGFDERFVTYEACDLHARLRNIDGEFALAKTAVVMHQHRETWRDYWKQQVNYGRGLGQFYVRWDEEIRWSRLREVREWISLAPTAVAACLPGERDSVLTRRGAFVKKLAQRVGFTMTYFRARERARWLNNATLK